MKLTFFTIFILFISVAPGYSVDWEFVTSDTTYDGIDISYFIDADEIKIMDGIRSYREKRVYTRLESSKNIGIVQTEGYYDCDNLKYVNASISFLSPEGKHLQGYLITGSDYTWQNITPGSNRLMYEYVCKFSKR
jgi:hypothetical protein